MNSVNVFSCLHLKLWIISYQNKEILSSKVKNLFHVCLGGLIIVDFTHAIQGYIIS